MYSPKGMEFQREDTGIINTRWNINTNYSSPQGVTEMNARAFQELEMKELSGKFYSTGTFKIIKMNKEKKDSTELLGETFPGIEHHFYRVLFTYEMMPRSISSELMPEDGYS